MSKIAGFWKSLKTQIVRFLKSFDLNITPKILSGKIQIFCEQSAQNKFENNKIKKNRFSGNLNNENSSVLEKY